MLTAAGALTLALGLGLGIGVVAAQDDDHSSPSMTDRMEDRDMDAMHAGMTDDMDAMHAGMTDDMTAECDSMSGHDGGSMNSGSMR